MRNKREDKDKRRNSMDNFEWLIIKLTIKDHIPLE